MIFEFSEEQQMLRDTLASFLRDRFTFEDRRAATRSDDGIPPSIWPSLAGELGLVGLTFPENAGGLGGGATENMIVMEELGKALSLEPWLQSVIMAQALLRDGGERAGQVMADIVAGDAIVVPALDYFPGSYGRAGSAVTHRPEGDGHVISGIVPLVEHAARATHLIVAAMGEGDDAPSLFLIDAKADGVSIAGYELVDGGRSADVTLAEVPVTAAALIAAGANAAARLATAFDAGVTGLCAEALGIQRMLLQWTVEYAKQREQFGVPIGNFQALQHRMAEMFIKLEPAASMTYLATFHLSDPPAARTKIVSAAKVISDQAGRFVGEQAVQIHGGMGMSKELPVADYFSRLTAISQQLGSTEYHFRRYEAAAFAPAAQVDGAAPIHL